MMRKIIFLTIIIQVITNNFLFVNADCCPRTGIFTCGGVGKCNVFCCNCDGGCLPVGKIKT